jgi:hypothetical protein
MVRNMDVYVNIFFSCRIMAGAIEINWIFIIG